MKNISSYQNILCCIWYNAECPEYLVFEFSAAQNNQLKLVILKLWIEKPHLDPYFHWNSMHLYESGKLQLIELPCMSLIELM